MSTQYGWRTDFGDEFWYVGTRERCEKHCQEYGLTMIARDITASRVVSIRA